MMSTSFGALAKLYLDAACKPIHLVIALSFAIPVKRRVHCSMEARQLDTGSAAAHLEAHVTCIFIISDLGRLTSTPMRSKHF